MSEDWLRDSLPPDLAAYVERLRREQPEKYGLVPHVLDSTVNL